MVYTRLAYTTPTLNSLQQEVAQGQWDLQALGDHKNHKQFILQLPIVCDVKCSSRSLWERKFSWNEWI